MTFSSTHLVRGWHLGIVCEWHRVWTSWCAEGIGHRRHRSLMRSFAEDTVRLCDRTQKTSYLEDIVRGWHPSRMASCVYTIVHKLFSPIRPMYHLNTDPRTFITQSAVQKTLWNKDNNICLEERDFKFSNSLLSPKDNLWGRSSILWLTIREQKKLENSDRGVECATVAQLWTILVDYLVSQLYISKKSRDEFDSSVVNAEFIYQRRVVFHLTVKNGVDHLWWVKMETMKMERVWKGVVRNNKKSFFTKSNLRRTIEG